MNKDASLKFRLQEARMLENGIQHYWELMAEIFHHIVPWLGGRMHFTQGGKLLIKSVDLADGNQQVMTCM